MPTLQKTIAEKFVKKLAESKEVDTAKIEQLQELLLSGKKPKVEELVRIFSLPAGGDLK